jgi:uncharacterized protein (DUF697 family)/tellurite resistance protein
MPSLMQAPPKRNGPASEAEAVFTLCLLAAFADGAKDARERAALIDLVERLPDGPLDTGAVLNDVLLGGTGPAAAARLLRTEATRRRAFEMALCVAEVDGRLTPAERDFLETLGRELQLPTAWTGPLCDQADQLAVAAQATALAASPGPAPEQSADASGVAPCGTADEAGRLALNYAMLNGALELLPQSLATLAVVPLQMKLVYRIGRLHGYELDRGHIRDFLGVAGIGLAAQVVEGYARRLATGWLGGKFGKTARRVADQATGSALTFATTYALGHLAQIYYAGGRQLPVEALRARFRELTGRGRELYQRQLPAIRERAAGIQLPDVLSLLKNP